eukprot:TRINITY_DN7553_c0_g1_i1.p1 TRINITY_DN7553_c0_g1~~TRINITY_DN7553_c0_g1_i1.p1  ORF type:complete len:358 (-),score=68.04 TRINITY_DN7553_c0_g1_i1:14-1087(-)
MTEYTPSDLTNTRNSILKFCDINQDQQLVIKPSIVSTYQDNQDIIDYLNAVIQTVPTQSPALLEDFGYEFREGKLVNAVNGMSFHWVNQVHYDALGDIIVDHIQTILKDKYHLKEIELPLDLEYTGAKTNIFVTEGDCDKLLVLIQGSGAVRAGQWARALCINDTLDIGTVFPYVEKALEKNYGIIIMNPNDNERPTEKVEIPVSLFLEERPEVPEIEMSQVEGLSHPYEHISYVWEHFVRPSNAKTISIVAHSAGGYNTTLLLNENIDEFEQRVAAVAFTDSVHMIHPSEPGYDYMQRKTRNYITSQEPLDTPLGNRQGGPCVSAGHTKHEFTSGFAFPSIFPYLEEKEQEHLGVD